MAVTFLSQPPQGTNIVADATLEKYVFASGVHKPEFSSWLTYCYPQYTLTSLLDQIGRFEGVKQDNWSWAEVERTREVATIASIVDTAPVFTITCDETTVYFVARDVLKTANDKQMIVTSATLVGGFQTLVVESIDSTSPLVAGDLVATDVISHLYNAHEEFSDEPTPRTYLPVTRNNDLGILRRTCQISTTELTNQVWMDIDGENHWYYADEQIAMGEFARDREIYLLTGKKSVSNSVESRSGNGILEFVEDGGTVGTFPAKVVETDIIDQVRQMLVHSPANEYMVLCGSQFMADLQLAMRAYYVNGGVNFGTVADADTVGIAFQTYNILGKTINFTHYQLFDDPKVFPVQASGIDYSNYSLWLNMGTDENNRPLITGKYKQGPDGTDYKFVHKATPGISAPTNFGDFDGFAANGKDAFSVHLYSYIGIEVRCTNQHGILRKA